MGIKFDLDQIINQVGRDKGINREILVEALESAVLSAAKKHFGHNRNLEATFNADLGEIEVHEFRTVVDEVRDKETQISLANAKKEFDPDCEVGDELGKKLNSDVLGRIAAQTAKQVIVQKLRDAERSNIFQEYRDRKGELINGIVQRVEKGNIIVNLGRTDAILPEREQIHKERYHQNDRIRAMILDIYPISRGPQIVLTRSHPEFLRKLFEINVPEIAEGVIEVKSVAREPGERAKIAVYSNDSNVDAQGACIGIGGTRVQAIVSEMRGERVDIVPWSPDYPSFVARSLTPANVERVIVDEEEHSMEVVVADDQLSKAIGKRGQNVKLASKLTGWKIDVRSESVADEETKRARSSLESIPGIGFGEAELLFQEGYRSVQEVAQVSETELSSIEGLEPERIKLIIEAAKKISKQVIQDEELKRNSDIDQLIIDEEIKKEIVQKGFESIVSLSNLTPEQLMEQTSLNVEQAKKLAQAAQSFLKFQRGV